MPSRGICPLATFLCVWACQESPSPRVPPWLPTVQCSVPVCPPGSPQCSVLTTHQSASLSRPGQAGAGLGLVKLKHDYNLPEDLYHSTIQPPTLESCMQLLARCNGVTMAPGDCGSHPSIFFLHPLLGVTAARLPGPSRRWDGPGGALSLLQTLAKFYQLSDLMTRIPIKILSHARASKLNICFEFEINISIHLNTQ